MTGIITDAAAQLIATRFLASNQVLRLFTNNHTPATGDTTSAYTEASGGGYSNKTLTGGSWTIGTDGNGNPQGVYAEQTFTFTGPLTTNTTIYGYYITDGTTLVTAELFATPRTPANNGDQEKITPTLKFRNNGSFA